MLAMSLEVCREMMVEQQYRVPTHTPTWLNNDVSPIFHRIKYQSTTKFTRKMNGWKYIRVKIHRQKDVFSLEHVQFYNIKGDGFITYNAAHHVYHNTSVQSIIKPLFSPLSDILFCDYICGCVYIVTFLHHRWKAANVWLCFEIINESIGLVNNKNVNCSGIIGGNG